MKLKAQGVVGYGVHDCVIVKRRDKEQAVETYRSVIRDYVIKHQSKHKHPHLNIDVSLTIEEEGKDKVRLSGSYAE